MSLTGRVGRHLNTNRHCQNRKKDQEIIIALLNLIPVADGGTAAGLSGRVVGGIASAALTNAIINFEQLHFGRISGYVDPGGAVWTKLNMLASRPQPAAPKPPRPANIWDNVTAKSVRTPLRAALVDDGKLSHAETVNIVRSALSDGVVSQTEIDSIRQIAALAKSLEPASRDLLNKFETMIGNASAGGPYQLDLDRQQYAAEIVCNFLERRGGQAFPNLSRNAVGVGLLMRIANPGTFKQGDAGICGPAAAMHTMASDDPVEFVRFAMNLFENGEGKFRKLTVRPGSDVKNYTPPSNFDHVDWLTMASLRDSENFFYDFDTVGDGDGGSSPDEMADWFKRAGYSDIRNDVKPSSHRDVKTVDEANRLWRAGYRVCLFIHDNMLYESTQSKSSSKLSHVVVQRSVIDYAGNTVRVTLFTWGDGNYTVPNGKTALPLADFLGNFFGFVAARP